LREHFLGAAPTHSVWNRDLAARLVVEPGDIVQMECTDASGGQVGRDSTVADFLKIDRSRIHALTGPIGVRGAKPGDVLEVKVLEVAHHGWAWTSVIAGLGFLDERFTDPALFQWVLEDGFTESLAPAVVPLRPFCGVMGVAPAEAGVFKTRPPGAFGGNLDVRELCEGSTLYLPVMNEGALFSAGDAHGAQGDGEVCINGMEMPASVVLQFHLHTGVSLEGPLVESSGRDAGAEWVVVESGEDAFKTAQGATSRMVDLLISRWGFGAVEAYVLCSVAMNLRLSQVVNRPMVTVSAGIAKSVLPGRRLF
jgi:acetamidase/formamidase